VTEVMTEPVSVAGARDKVTQTVVLGLLDSSLRLKNTRSATVTVQIVPAPVERPARSRAVHLRGLAAGLQAEATPASVDVVLRGSREAVAHVEPDDVVAYVDVTGLGAGVYTLTVHADSPQDVGVTRIDPASIQVRITSGR
jgi:YbbR domain-containing protein